MNESYKKVNVEMETEDKNSVLSHYKKMIELRQKSKYSDCLIYGEFVPLDLKNDEIIAYSRKDDNYELICINNFSSKSQEIDLKDKFSVKEILIENIEDIQINENRINLKPYQSFVAKVEKL